MSGLLKVPLFKDELLSSFLSRTAFANGSRHLRSFCRDLGLSYSGIASGRQADIERAASKLGFSPEQFNERHVAFVGNKLVSFRGEVFQTTQMTRIPSQFCPLCLRDDEAKLDRMPGTRRYARLDWTMRSIATCRLHFRPLIAAGERKMRGSMDLVDWIEQLPARPDQCDAAMLPTPFERYVSDRLREGNGQEGGNHYLPLSHSIELSELLGMASVFGRSFAWRKYSQDQLREARSRGFSILMRGAPAIDKLLDTLSKEHRTDDVYNVHKLYGDIVMMSQRNLGSCRVFAQWLRSHALTRYSRLSLDALITGTDPPLVAISEVAATSNAFVAVVHAYLEQHRATRSKGPDESIQYVGAGTADAATIALSNALTIKGASEILGCSVPDVQGLVVTGLIKPLVGRPELDGKFRTTDRFLAAPLKRLLANLVANSRNDVSSTIPLHSAVRYLGCELGDALNAISASRLKPACLVRSQPKLDGLRINLEDLRRALETEGMIGAVTVRVRLGLTQLALKELAQQDVIAAKLDEFGNPVVFHRNSVETFERRYIGIHQLADNRRASVAKTRADVLKLGINRAFPERLRVAEIYHQSDLRSIEASPDDEGSLSEIGCVLIARPAGLQQRAQPSTEQRAAVSRVLMWRQTLVADPLVDLCTIFNTSLREHHLR